MIRGRNVADYLCMRAFIAKLQSGMKSDLKIA